jgi:nicotinate-nucleotide adenylyltransferase
VKHVGLFGGSFDPVHVGHLRAALEAAEHVGLDELRFVPCAVSPGKPRPHASGSLRREWLRQAIGDRPGWQVDDRELRRGGVSYTVETLAEIRETEPDARLYWMVGSDAFCGLHGWREADRLGRLAHWIVLLRPGFEDRLPPPQAPDWCRSGTTDDPAKLRRDPAGGVLYLPVTPLGISATAVRARIRRGQRLDYLVPEPIRGTLERADCYDPP